MHPEDRRSQWVRDREAWDEEMGRADYTGAESLLIGVGTILVVAVRLGFFVGFCAVVFLVGRCTVGL